MECFVVSQYAIMKNINIFEIFIISVSVVTFEKDVNKDAVNQIIWFFLKTCKELGSTGIGADFNYDKGRAFHVDIASKNKDLSSGNYSNKAISIKYGGKQEVLTIAKLIKKVKITKNSRYWGKDDEGKLTAHGAPASLKDIFQNKKIKK